MFGLVVCLRDGREKDGTDGYGPDVMFIAAKNTKRPAIFDGEGNPTVESDGVVYGGCIVKANITLWAQDNTFGKRVNASLGGVRFQRDAPSFGGGRTVAATDFAADDDDLLG